jgi:hypothetical protein
MSFMKSVDAFSTKTRAGVGQLLLGAESVVNGDNSEDEMREEDEEEEVTKAKMEKSSTDTRNGLLTIARTPVLTLVRGESESCRLQHTVSGYLLACVFPTTIMTIMMMV